MDGARTALRRYEDQNGDLPASTRRLLALAALGRYFGRRILEELTSSRLPRAPFRDWAWRWWNVLDTAALGEHWDEFAKRAQRGGLREAATWLRSVVSPFLYHTFLRRAGTNPHNDHRPKRGNVIWTKGGCWRIESPFTTLLVKKQHLPERPLVKIWQKRLGHEGVRLIERELMRLIDPDTTFRVEAIRRVMDYVKWRIPSILNWPKRKTSADTLAWFFQWRMPCHHGTVEVDQTGWNLVLRGMKTQRTLLKQLEW